MSETAEKLKLELSQISAQERAEIAYFLIQSLGDEIEISWDTELNKRLQDIHNQTAMGEPYDQVLSELREKYS